MVEIALIICIPLAFIAGVFSALKSVQLGLKWRMQTEEKKEPEFNNPIVKAVEDKQNKGIEQYNKEVMQEWLYGAGGEG